MTSTGDTKERLLEAAQALYLEGGADAFSLREVARRVGVSAPAVYRHFESKEALLDAIRGRGFEAFASYLVRSLAGETPRARLLGCGRCYLAFAVERPHDYRVIFMSGVPERGATGTDAGPTTSATFRFLVDRVRECIDARVIARGDETAIATMIWAFVHGLASLRLSGHLATFGDERAFAAFHDTLVARFVDGLR